MDVHFADIQAFISSTEVASNTHRFEEAITKAMEDVTEAHSEEPMTRIPDEPGTFVGCNESISVLY